MDRKFWLGFPSNSTAPSAADARPVVRRTWVAGLLFALAVFAPHAAAEVVEQVVAVVDEHPIFLTELRAQFLAAAQGMELDLRDSLQVTRLRDSVLEDQIRQKVLYLEAQAREITIDETEISARVGEAIERNIREIGSKDLFRVQLEREGLTEDDLRGRYADQARVELMINRLVQMEIQSEMTAPSDEEVRTFYDEHRAEMPQREAGIHLQHIQILVKPDSILVAKAQNLARDVGGQIRSGALTFQDAARRYSDDPNGREGGDLHQIERGDFRGHLGEDFENAIFDQQVGSVSAPLLSPLGYHLVLVRDRDPEGAWVRASHILFRVPVVASDKYAAEQRAQEVHARLNAGEAFEDLAAVHSDDAQSRELGGDLGWVPGQVLEGEIRTVIDALEIGAHAAPLEAEGGFHIFRVLGRENERDFTFEEIKGELIDWVQTRKMETRYTEWVAELSERHFIERRPWTVE